MKTLRLLSMLLLTGFLMMSMGFPTDLADKNNSKKKPAAQVQHQTKKNAKILKATEKEPVQVLSLLIASKMAKITVKVFDVKGMLVMKEEVSMDDFLGKSKKCELPGGSTFVMFHQNTAYYFLESGSVH